MRAARIALRPEGGRWLGAGRAHRLVAMADGLEIVPLAPAISAAQSPREGAPFRIKATRLARGERVIHGVGPEARVEKGSHLVVEKREFAQHIDNREEGVEISYSFAHPPAGEGDLRVVLDVEGETFVGRTGEGLHFADPTTGVGVRFGQATWIDARGKRSPVRVRVEGSHIELRVKEAVLASSAYPAVLDPLISPEFGMDEPTLALGSRRRHQPVVAWNGSSYLVAWQDGNDQRLHGTRFASNGTLIDAVDLPLTTAAVSNYALASDGSGFFLTYKSSTPGLYGQHYDGNGQAVGTPITLGTETAYNSDSVVFDGTNYVAVWLEGGAARRARITTAGQVLDPGGVIIAAASSVDIASNGAGSFVTWTGPNELVGTNLDAQGNLLHPAGVALTAPGFEIWDAGVTWAGQTYFVAYGRYDGEDNAYMAGTRIDPVQGTPLDLAWASLPVITRTSRGPTSGATA
ncbi:hypothetical protein [Polyangium sp. 15x6]|uniref:hypothetical protein n=1 Tax=Polyangium sp. 15x6 TaxID=3042687 RepID=UPI00249B0690|nr:hypothetical protein [Polyangium sp. 15x6]MDI3289900.1 hypothetical protein [Polyangium sp. 15x6]